MMFKLDILSMNNFAVVSGTGPASHYFGQMLLQRCNIVTKDSLV
jgi:hypothetical protein